jgi:hypothetical protein
LLRRSLRLRTAASALQPVAASTFEQRLAKPAHYLLVAGRNRGDFFGHCGFHGRLHGAAAINGFG